MESTPYYLQLGAARPQLALPQLAALVTPQWVHLGEPPFEHETEPAWIEQRLASTCYLPFHYRRGQRLPFADDRFRFVFSEHFFEHLFLDEAGELFKECRRVMAAGACLRIVVPDADLRTYLPPEPPGYTTGDARWSHPDKHKTRWSIYSLEYLLQEFGFRTRGIIYCDKSGNYHRNLPRAEPAFYDLCPDRRYIDDTSYILRFENSLVVDAIK